MLYKLVPGLWRHTDSAFKEVLSSKDDHKQCHRLKDTLRSDRCHEWASGLRVVSCFFLWDFRIVPDFLPRGVQPRLIFSSYYAMALSVRYLVVGLL